MDEQCAMCGDPACIRCERARVDNTWVEIVLCEYHFAGLHPNDVRNARYFRTGLMGENILPLPIEA